MSHTLQARSARDELRTLAPLRVIDALRALDRGGAELTLFSTNDYLALSDHPAPRAAAREALERAGMGPRGAALICGHSDEHEALCTALAALKGSEAALLFPTGFAANLASVTALADEGCAIFSDELNHASIIDATRLARRAGAALFVYRHRDADHLESLLRRCDRPRRLIITDSIFSMDGTLAPLPDLVALRARYDALLAVDEAHATLVFGARGGGLTEHFGVTDQVDLHIGTLSKAVGALGGFAAGSRRMVSVLLNRGRAGIYSTALPLPLVAAARAALCLPDLPQRRDRVHLLRSRVGDALGLRTFSPIVPIEFGEATRAVEVSQALLAEGVHAVAIRPPTVPEGRSRIRVTLSAGHRDEEVAHLCEVLRPLVTRD